MYSICQCGTCQSFPAPTPPTPLRHTPTPPTPHDMPPTPLTPPRHTPSDIEKIHEGIGDKLAILFQWVATFFAGIVIGFSKEWRLTLFMLGITPLIAVCAIVFTKVSRVQRSVGSPFTHIHALY